jgi:hypothetical protein
MRMDAEKWLEKSRRCFARSLVGRWSTAQGTFDVVMGQHWEIRPDGTGNFIVTGAFGHPRSETRFEWRQSEDFLFEIRLTECIAFHPDAAIELDDEDRAWKTIRYDFAITGSDFGFEVGLIDVAQAGMKFEGFLYSLAPMAYRGPKSFAKQHLGFSAIEADPIDPSRGGMSRVLRHLCSEIELRIVVLLMLFAPVILMNWWWLPAVLFLPQGRIYGNYSTFGRRAWAYLVANELVVFVVVGAFAGLRLAVGRVFF